MCIRDRVRAAVPEEHKAYGVIVCGAALGDRAFEEHFLRDKTAEITSEIESVVNKLAGDSAHVLSTAIYYSLQARVDFLLETHLPSLTRSLARATDEALSKAYIKAFGFNVLDPNGQRPGEQDPSFLRDLAGLKAGAGGCGYRNVERRAPFLNTLNIILPQMVGGKSPLWPTLAAVIGENSFDEVNKDRRWNTFWNSGSEFAAEHKSEVLRIMELRAKAALATGKAPPESSIFDVPAEGFGHNIRKLHKEAFDDIRALEAIALQERATKLLPNDQRKLAFQQRRTCKFSNVLFSGTPIAHVRFHNDEFHTAVQSVLGAPLSILKPLAGCPIKSSARGPPPLVDPFGNNLKKLIGATGGGTLKNHNSFVDTLSFWLAKSKVPHRGGINGKPRSCKDIFLVEPGQPCTREMRELFNASSLIS